MPALERPAPYREYGPHPALAPLVACYWSYRGRNAGLDGPRPEAVVPDACIDLLFDRRSGGAAVVGAMSQPLTVLRDRGMDLLGVRFRPGAARVFLDVPAGEVTDLTVPLGSVLGTQGEELRRRVSQADGTEDATRAIEAFLLRLSGQDARGDDRVLAAIRLLARARGDVRMDDLARHVGLGRRQLERAFLAWVGLGPKATARTLRFQAALGDLLTRPAVSLSSIALAAGYHDQAHFTRDFRFLSGETPGAYRARRATQPADDAFLQDPSPSPA